MIQVIDMGGYYNIYSDNGKKILEKPDTLWNATQDEPIAVHKGRYANGDYVESDEIEEFEE